MNCHLCQSPLFVSSTYNKFKKDMLCEACMVDEPTHPNQVNRKGKRTGLRDAQIKSRLSKNKNTQYISPRVRSIRFFKYLNRDGL